MKGWKLVTLAVALGVVLVFAGVAIAKGAGADHARSGVWGMMGGWMMGDRQDRAGSGTCGPGTGLMGNADFRADMRKLREEHLNDMQAWWDKYGSDTSSSAAQKAFSELRVDHWNDMRTLFKKYGVDLPAERPQSQGGTGVGAPGAGCYGGRAGQGSASGQARGMGTGMMGGGMMGTGAI